MFLKNQKILLAAVVVCVCLAALLFYFNNYKIPKVMEEVDAKVRAEIDTNAMPKQKVAVVTGDSGISKYTELTGQILQEKVILIDIPVKYLVKGAVASLSDIEGKVAKEDLGPGEQISVDSLSTDKKWYGQYQRLKEYAVASIVAEEVKIGNIVDILVSYGDGHYDVVVPKTKIIKLINPYKTQSQGQQLGQSQGAAGGTGGTGAAGGNSIPAGSIAPGSSGYTVIIAVDEVQYKDLELASHLGRLETRLYLDENQPESKKTFNYDYALKRMKQAKGGSSPQPAQTAFVNTTSGSYSTSTGGDAVTDPAAAGQNSDIRDDRVPIKLAQ